MSKPRKYSMFNPKLTPLRIAGVAVLVAGIIGGGLTLSTHFLLTSTFYKPVLGEVLGDARVESALGEPVHAASWPLVASFWKGADSTSASYFLWLTGSAHQGYVRCTILQKPRHTDIALTLRTLAHTTVLRALPTPKPEQPSGVL